MERVKEQRLSLVTSTERPDQTEVAGVNVVGAFLKKREASSIKFGLEASPGRRLAAGKSNDGNGTQ